MDGKCYGASEVGEEGCILRSPLNANGITSRKGKLSDDRCPMNAPFVPKRLRSAFNKRVNQSVSSPLSDSKRRQQHSSNGTQLCNSLSAEKVKQNMLNSVSKDEEEVAETLTSLANLMNITKSVETKEDGKYLDENLEMKATSSSPLAAPKEMNTKFLVPSNDTTLGNPSPCAPCVEEKPTVMSVTKKFDAEANGPSLPNSPKKLSSDEEPVEGVTPLRDAVKLSNPLGTSLQYFPVKGMSQPTQLDSLLVQRQELGPPSMKHDLQSFEQKPDCVTHDLRGKAPDGQPGLHSQIHEQLSIPSSCKAATNPNSVTVCGRPCSTNSLPIEKLSLTSADKKRPWKKCITHVYITGLIQNHQKTLERQLIMLQCNQSIPSEGTNHAVPVSSGSLLERSMLEARNRKLQDERLLQAQKGCDFLPLSAVGDTKSLVNGMKSVGTLHVPCPPNQASMPFTVPRGCYTSQYHEKLAAGSTQQVQLQLPMCIASGQLHGQHFGQSTTGNTTTKQQQLLWQAQFAHYMQNGRHNSCPSPFITQPPSIFPLHGDYNPHNLHQPFILPVHSSSSSSLSSRSKQKQIIAESFR